MDAGIHSIFSVDSFRWDEIVKLLVACFLGGILGLERELTRHPAGFRTHILVSMGAATAMLLAFYLMRTFEGTAKFDPGRAIQGVITGMGFIGAGAIMKEGNNVHGLTTAASLWVTATVGMLSGSGAFGLAIVVTLLATITMVFSPHTLAKHPDEHVNPPPKP